MGRVSLGMVGYVRHVSVCHTLVTTPRPYTQPPPYLNQLGTLLGLWHTT